VDAGISSAQTLPKRPDADSYYWFPIFLETIRGSGKRITIALIIIDPAGIIHGKPLFDQKRAQHLLLGKTSAFMVLVEECIQEAIAYTANGMIGDWEPSVPGACLGAIRSTMSRDLDTAYYLAQQKSAFLGSLLLL